MARQLLLRDSDFLWVRNDEWLAVLVILILSLCAFHSMVARLGTMTRARIMRTLSHLFANNKAWSKRIRKQNPEFFRNLSQQQSPSYLWIGCADSRVPANEIVGLLPGELFVHRNIANLVVHTDLNCLSVMQFAVDVLKVRHIVVCGHYGCSGVRAALQGDRLGLSDNWLRHVQDVREKHQHHLAGGPADSESCDRLCELNVIEQVANVCQTTIARDAWQRGQALSVHGWIYALRDGLLRDLNMTVTAVEETRTAYQAALGALSGSRRAGGITTTEAPAIGE